MTVTIHTPSCRNRDIGQFLRFSHNPPNTTTVDQNADLTAPGTANFFSHFCVPWFSQDFYYVF